MSILSAVDCGTLHIVSNYIILVNSVNPSSTSVYSVNVRNYVPNGTKAILASVRLTNAGTGNQYIRYHPSSTSSDFILGSGSGGSAGDIAVGMDVIPVYSRYFYWSASGTNISDVDIFLAGYYL
jgi:hypothetical protein